MSIGALLVDPPPYLETAKVFDMVLALPKVGSAKATKIFHSCRVSPNKTFGGSGREARDSPRLEHVFVYRLVSRRV